MEHAKFAQLVKAGEKPSVDFKIECNAFLPASEPEKAELAKDICAMANSGNTASYILVGVSDDGKHFRSVENAKLTDENVQSFCKTAISPPPRVKVHRECWRRVVRSHANKTFVIIQIGPQARQAFCLARDFINYKQGFCYRRNEVWIRRGTTSDLASPAEVALLVKGKSPIDGRESLVHCVHYERLPANRQLPALMQDLAQCVEELGGQLVNGRVVLPIQGVRYVWGVAAVRDFELKPKWILRRRWRYEAGFLLLAIGTTSKRDFAFVDDTSFRTDWGRIAFMKSDSGGFLALFRWPGRDKSPLYRTDKLDVMWPDTARDFALPIVTLSKIRDTRILRKSVLGLIGFLERDCTTAERIEVARRIMNDNLRDWAKTGQIDQRNWVPQSTRDDNNRRMMQDCQAILELSDGGLH